MLADRAAASAGVSNPAYVASLLNSMREAGAREQATLLAHRIDASTDFRNARGVALLLHWMREAGGLEQTAALARRAALEVSVSTSHDVRALLDVLRGGGCARAGGCSVRARGRRDQSYPPEPRGRPAGQHAGRGRA